MKCILFICCCFYLSLSKAADITVGVGDQSEIGVRLENDKLVGIVAENYQCVLSHLNLAINYQVMPQARMLQLLKSGKLDIGLPLVQITERDQYATFTDPIFWAQYYIYANKEIDLSVDLSGYTFTTVRTSAREIEDFLSHKPNFYDVGSWEQALEMVKHGRVDGILLPALVVNQFSVESFEGLYQLDVGKVPVSMYVSKKSNDKKIVKRLNTLIKRCLIEK